MDNIQAKIKATQEEVDKNYEYLEKHIDEIRKKSDGRSFVLLHKDSGQPLYKVIVLSP